MSDEKKINSGIAAVINNLKNNPKAMYAAIGAVVVVVLLLVMGGSDDGDLGQVQMSAISPGQLVTVHSPNIGDTWLTAAPKMGSEDIGEEKDQYICLVKGSASATVDEETVVTFIPYVKLTVKDGECQGKTGWTPRVNVSTK